MQYSLLCLCRGAWGQLFVFVHFLNFYSLHLFMVHWGVQSNHLQMFEDIQKKNDPPSVFQGNDVFSLRKIISGKNVSHAQPFHPRFFHSRGAAVHAAPHLCGPPDSCVFLKPGGQVGRLSLGPARGLRLPQQQGPFPRRWRRQMVLASRSLEFNDSSGPGATGPERTISRGRRGLAALQK